MSKKILGLDLGSNSVGWALLSADDRLPAGIVDLGVRIFNKAVEEKTPTPKNAKRRERRLARRVIQRRARRKQRMLNYLVSLRLLPSELKNNPQPEIILNQLGDPYKLRAKALDDRLLPFELGRVLLHLVQRRGFLSNKKTLLGSEMLDDPDVTAVLEELGEDKPEVSADAEESSFKADISELKKKISEANCRTLGEYLASLDDHQCKRNRAREGGYLRTDRQMYREELDAIWSQQSQYHDMLTEETRFQMEEIIFHQRPLKLDANRVGKCSLEKRHKRCRTARLEYQKFRYLQDINNLRYLDPYTEKEVSLTEQDREKLRYLFESNSSPTFGQIRKALGLKGVDFNLEGSVKKLKGNTTASAIRAVLPEWDDFSEEKRHTLVEDLLSIRKKTALKKRLIGFWGLEGKTAVALCLLEFEPGHGSHSSKAIKKLLPYLEEGQLYSDARVSADYGYEQSDIEPLDKLGPPPEIPNPIVRKGLHELRRVVNAVIAEYGKPDIIRIEMARDLEMNTKRYKQFMRQQGENTKANDKAVEEYKVIASRNPGLGMSKYPSRNDKIKYRLWRDQDMRCAYSGEQINMTTLFSAEVEIDHILPLSQSLDDSYMNKVVCFSSENRYKGNRTPREAYSGNEEKWGQITSAINRWDKRKLKSKIERFYKTEVELLERDFIGSQLTDTRYISKEAGNYLKTLGVDVTFTKGVMTSWLRQHWKLNELIGNSDQKERTDHRHHAIDAAVIACIDRHFYQILASNAKALDKEKTGLTMHDLLTDPPFESFRKELEDRLESMIISFSSQKKISGALHEETGVGFIEGVGTVYRKDLDGSFTQVDKIIDPIVQDQVRNHLAAYDNKPKQAFAEGITVFHRDGKTPIKRVRVKQADTTLKDLEKSKFGVRNRQGEVFRWMAYGNLHHVEIIRNKTTGKYKGVFVTTMEAAHRVRGVGKSKVAVIETDHGDQFEFVIALHINDLVSVDVSGGRKFFRIQKLEQPFKLMLRLHTAATLDQKDEMIRKSVNSLMTEFSLVKHNVNAIGKLQDDQENH